MSNQQRLGLVALAAVVAVVAFVVARPDDDEGTAATTPASATAPAEEPATAPAEEPATDAAPEPEPEPVRVQVRGGQPAGGVAEIAVSKGETVRLTVSSDAPQQVHVHGYDLFEDAAPGSPARFRFAADLEGVFEVELEGAHTLIAELRVEP